ncbi:flavin-containing monooxygenase [Alcanivorax sediminis]|nr:NAD(P)-binding domain-containing protein [Alcanivorax sediminis]
MKASNKLYDCVVVGAGPGGVVATKELIENGVDNIVCLEKSDSIGGVFAKGYDSLLLTSSATFSMFSDFLNKPGEDNHFWSKEEAVEYWQKYASHFGVNGFIRFNTEVTNVDRDGDLWRIDLGDDHIFSRRIILATGNNSIESYPDWSEKLKEIQFSHSKHYKNAESFVGKRVLVVGGGESASDIALDISRVADQCWISLRESAGWVVPRKRGEYATDISTHRGIWDLPRQYGTYFTRRSIEIEKEKNDPLYDAVAMLNSKIPDPKGIWSTYGTKTTALAEAIAYHNCKVVGEIVNVADEDRRLESADRISLENVDAVVFSTGYVNITPFMPEQYRQCDPRTLYKHMIHPELGDSLCWIGVARPGFGSQFPIMEMQSRYFALLCSKQAELPNHEMMHKSINEDHDKNIEQFGKNAQRIRSLVDYFRYMDGMAEVIGCKPPLKEYFVRYPLLWLTMMYGPAQATQYRLVGPGSKKKIAHRILRQLPVSKFNNVVKMGLRMRVAHALDSVNLYAQRKLL